MATVNGSLELIKDTGENLGLPVMDCDPANVPLLAGVLFGLTGITAVSPPTYIPPEHANDTPPATVDPNIVGQWTATTPDLRSATLLLHQEAAFDTTLIGRWLATQGGA